MGEFWRLPNRHREHSGLCLTGPSLHSLFFCRRDTSAAPPNVLSHDSLRLEITSECVTVKKSHRRTLNAGSLSHVSERSIHLTGVAAAADTTRWRKEEPREFMRHPRAARKGTPTSGFGSPSRVSPYRRGVLYPECHCPAPPLPALHGHAPDPSPSSLHTTPFTPLSQCDPLSPLNHTHTLLPSSAPSSPSHPDYTPLLYPAPS